MIPESPGLRLERWRHQLSIVAASAGITHRTGRSWLSQCDRGIHAPGRLFCDGCLACTRLGFKVGSGRVQSIGTPIGDGEILVKFDRCSSPACATESRCFSPSQLGAQLSSGACISTEWLEAFEVALSRSVVEKNANLLGTARRPTNIARTRP